MKNVCETHRCRFFFEISYTMPKYSKKCNNRHFHEKWNSGDVQIINLRREGLLEMGNIFTQVLEEHLGRTPPHIANVCI